MKKLAGRGSPATVFMSTTKLLRRPRRNAAAMLFVWLFATFASWANACLVQPSAAEEGRSEHHLRIDASADVRAHHAATEAGAEDDPDAGLQSCISFCELEQSIVAKVQPTKADGGADAGMPPPAGFCSWPTQAPDRAEPCWRPRAAPPPPGLPVSIAFLRLTR
jgi:hypothetical protein